MTATTAKPAKPVWIQYVCALKDFITPKEFPRLHDIVTSEDDSVIPGPETIMEIEALVLGVFTSVTTNVHKSYAQSLNNLLLLRYVPAATCTDTPSARGRL